MPLVLSSSTAATTLLGEKELNMLESHFAAIEKTILAISEVASNTGHNLHRGTPREVFIKEFLEDHLSEKLGIGTGEIIDSTSLPREKRNQIDIVIYRKEYPSFHPETVTA